MATADPSFADKLNLALKALSIGRARLAVDLGVDKSMVSRWLGGTARPSTHNLERLTRLIASACPGFSLLDWDNSEADFHARLGLAKAADRPAPATAKLCDPGTLPFGSLGAAALETARRASAYIGRWQVTRLAGTGEMKAFRELVMIRPDGDGLRIEHFFTHHWLLGWLIVSEGALYAFVADSGDGSFASYCLHGVVGPRAARLDGIFSCVGGHRSVTPFAQTVVFERIGELQDEAADDAWRATAMASWSEIALDDLAPEIRTAITVDCGADAAARGGEAILRLPATRSLAYGGY